MSISDRSTPQLALRTVIGVHDTYVVVRMTNGTAKVDLLPHSTLPLVGDSILVMQAQSGLLGLVLPPDMTSITYTAWMPVPPVPPHDTLPAQTSRIQTWEIVADTSGDLTLDILKNGVSIVGATPPTLVAQQSNTGFVGDDWDTLLERGDNITFVTSGVSGISAIRVFLPAVRI